MAKSSLSSEFLNLMIGVGVDEEMDTPMTVWMDTAAWLEGRREKS